MIKFFTLFFMISFFISGASANELFVATGKSTSREGAETAKARAYEAAKSYFGEDVRQVSDWINDTRFNPRPPYSGSHIFRASFSKINDIRPYSIVVAEKVLVSERYPLDALIVREMNSVRKAARFYCDSEIIEPTQWKATQIIDHGLWEVSAEITCQ